MGKSISITGLRVLQIIPRLDGGGAEAATIEITQALTRAGAHSFVAFQGNKIASEMERAVRAAGGEVFHLPVASKNPLSMYRNIKRLRQLCVAMNIDIIHARSRAPAWSGFFTARQLRLPFITTYHSKVHDRPWLKVFYNSVMTRGVKVIANSEFTAKRIRAIHKTPEANIAIVPRGCDPKKFDAAQFSDADKQAMRAIWGVAKDETLVMCPARLTRWKGQEILIAALGDVVAKNAELKGGLKGGLKVKLVLVGGDQGRLDYTQGLKRLAAENGLTGKIVFAGHVSDMPRAYATANLVVLPSLMAEPFGRTAVEAQASGVPVIASNQGGFCETVKTNNGWRVEANNRSALAATLSEALNMTPKERRAMGGRARDFVTTHYTLELMCDKTLKLYADIMQNNNATT